jgi:threonine/homoserine/homoserine lactone efflux protein
VLPVVSAHAAVAALLASALIIVVPGPAVLFVVGRALSEGRRTAVASVVGNSTGCVLAAALVAIGLGVLVEDSTLVYTVVKLLGAGYLIWLGVQAFRRRSSPEVVAGTARRPSFLRAVRTGVAVGLTNPKGYIIFAAVLPQFVDRSAGHVPAQLFLLALVPVCLGVVTDLVWALSASAVRDWVAEHPSRLRAVTRTGGLCMIGLGVSMAAMGGRP